MSDLQTVTRRDSECARIGSGPSKTCPKTTGFASDSKKTQKNNLVNSEALVRFRLPCCRCLDGFEFPPVTPDPSRRQLLHQGLIPFTRRMDLMLQLLLRLLEDQLLKRRTTSRGPKERTGRPVWDVGMQGDLRHMER